MTSSHRITLQPALVLHQRAYRDTSLLLELFTPQYGRVGAVARGVRKEKSKTAALLQPFRRLVLSWSGRGELVTLGAVEEDGPAFALTGNALPCGFYLNELLMRLLQRNDPHPELFNAYVAALGALIRVEPAALDVVLRLFEKRLLQELGYGLLLDHAADSGAALQADALYNYEIERGPVAYNARSFSVAVHGSTLLALARDEFPDELARREGKQLMRTVLAHYLGDKPLHSRELFQRAPREKAAS